MAFLLSLFVRDDPLCPPDVALGLGFATLPAVVLPRSSSQIP